MAAPSAEEIRKAAAACGLVERRPECSSTLFFRSDALECDYNVFYTTRTVMTRLSHPSRGDNQLFRSAVYTHIYELMTIFNDPRSHTGLGYRIANDASRGCVQCGIQKKRGEFSKNQWSMGPDKNRCKDCVQSGSAIDGMSSAMEDMGMTVKEDPDASSSTTSSHQAPKDNARRAKLTEDNLMKLEHTTEKFSRRQFRCPNHGVFFKKVPNKKPVASCPQCKNEGRLNKWKAVPRKEEKGFGLFRCPSCQSTWGSSRACRGLGQFCGQENCDAADTPVYPFKILPEKKRCGGGRSRPMEPLPEPEPVYHGHSSPGEGGGGVGGEGGGGEGTADSFAVELVKKEEPKAEPLKAMMQNTKPKLRHRCTGCDTGLCNNRTVPISQRHDSTGSTGSTCSEKTWTTASGIGEYADRDADS